MTDRLSFEEVMKFGKRVKDWKELKQGVHTSQCYNSTDEVCTDTSFTDAFEGSSLGITVRVSENWREEYGRRCSTYHIGALFGTIELGGYCHNSPRSSVRDISHPEIEELYKSILQEKEQERIKLKEKTRKEEEQEVNRAVADARKIVVKNMKGENE